MSGVGAGSATQAVRGNAISTVSMVFWATGFPVTELLLRTWHPMLLAPVRLLLGAVFAFIVLMALGRVAELARVPWRTALPIGGFGLGTAVVLLVVAQNHADAVVVAIIATLVPLVSAFVGVVQGRERIGPRLALALVLAITGGTIATGALGRGISGLEGGEVVMFVSIFFWVWFSRASIERLSMLSDLTKTTVGLGSAGVLAALVAAVMLMAGLIEPRYAVTSGTLGLILWLGAIAVCGSILLWLWAARLIGVTVAAMHQNMVPFYVMLMALALGGGLGLEQVAGGAIVVCGTALAQLPDDRLKRWRLRSAGRSPARSRGYPRH